MSKVYRVEKWSRTTRGTLTEHTLLRSTDASVWVPSRWWSEGERKKRDSTGEVWFEDLAEAVEYSEKLLQQQEKIAYNILNIVKKQRGQNSELQPES